MPSLTSFNRAAAEAAPPPTDFQKLLSAVRRHKMIVALVTAVGTGLGIVGAHFLSRQYEAKTILWIQSDIQPNGHPNPDADRQNVISADVITEAPGWVELVKSNTVLDSVVRNLRLYLKPKNPEDAAPLAGFTATDPVRSGRYVLSVSGNGSTWELRDKDSSGFVQKGAVGDSICSACGFRWQPTRADFGTMHKVQFNVEQPYETALDVIKALKIRTDDAGSFLMIQYKDKNPQRAAATVNALSERLVAVAASMKRQKFEELATILGGQYDAARQRLDSVQVQLRDFRVKNAVVLGAASYGTAFADPYPNGSRRPEEDPMGIAAQGNMERLQVDRRAIDQALQQNTPGTGQIVDALAAIPTVQSSPRLMEALQDVTKKQADLRELRARYTDEAAPVVALRQQVDSMEGTVVPTLARQLTAEMDSRLGLVRPQVNQAVGTLRRLPTLALNETRLAQDVQSAQQLADNVEQRYEEARLALVSSLPDVRILDRAVSPHRPMASLGPLLVILAFLTSLSAAAFAVLVKDNVDPRVRYPEQVTHGMKLTILAAMPHVSWRLGEEGSAPVLEALRGLRLRVLQAHTEPGPLVLTITSPAMGEGKSFVSSNLALSFADAGFKTILVDGDVRRGAQHLALEAQQRPGLTDVLAGTVPLATAVQDTGFPGLRLVAAGSRMHRAPELLLSPRLQEIIDELRTMADVIIVDSPPLAAGVDPVALGTVTGNLMLVLRQGTTDMPMTLSKLELLEQFPIRTIGAVLNDVPERGAFKYYTYEPDESEFLASGDGDEGPRRPPILAGKGPE